MNYFVRCDYLEYDLAGKKECVLVGRKDSRRIYVSPENLLTGFKQTLVRAEKITLRDLISCWVYILSIQSRKLIKRAVSLTEIVSEEELLELCRK